MARKNVVKSHKMIDAGDMADPIVSDIVNVINMDKASIHISWAGVDVDGEIVVEARNGADDSWYALALDSINLTEDEGDIQILLTELPFTDIRVQYAWTAGTGELNATITMKQVGG